MREVRAIRYQIIKESNVEENFIYAFFDKKDKDFAYLCRKDDEFFWKCFKACNMVWHKKYKSIEDAIDGVLKVDEFNTHNCSSIMEFENVPEFINWCAKQLHLEQ